MAKNWCKSGEVFFFASYNNFIHTWHFSIKEEFKKYFWIFRFSKATILDDNFFEKLKRLCSKKIFVYNLVLRSYVSNLSQIGGKHFVVVNAKKKFRFRFLRKFGPIGPKLNMITPFTMGNTEMNFCKNRNQKCFFRIFGDSGFLVRVNVFFAAMCEKIFFRIFHFFRAARAAANVFFSQPDAGT